MNSDFRSAWRQSRDRQHRSRQALQAVAARSAGRSRPEIGELITAELRARDLRVPSGELLELMIDRVQAGDDLGGQARVAVRGLGTLARLGAQLSRDVRAEFRGLGPHLDLGDQEPLFIDPDRNLPEVPVQLTPGADHWLASPAGREFSEIFVQLQPGSAGDGLAVRAGDHVVGALSPDDASLFAAAMAAGQSGSQPVVAEAALRRAAGAAVTLHLYRPRQP